MTVPDRRDEARAELRVQVASAARIVSPVWPLGTFVAVNPLGGLVDRPFDEAVGMARRTLGIRGVPGTAELVRALDDGHITLSDVAAALARHYPGLADDEVDAAVERLLNETDADPAVAPRTAAERCDAALGTDVAATVDEETAKWCAAFADADGSRWPMPGRERGFYRAWRDLAGRGPALRRLALPGVRERLAALPDAPEDAVIYALQRLRVSDPARRAELRGHFARQPGWASFARWCQEQGVPGFDPMQLLAVRMAYEVELLAGAGRRVPGGPMSLPDLLRAAGTHSLHAAETDDRCADGLIALEILEAAYADRLLTALDRPSATTAAAQRPAAQAVFCIDARSEGLRRHLEDTGPYETLGFAGFFAIAMRFRALGSTRADAQAPVLLDPRHVVDEVATPDTTRRHRDGRAALAAAEHGFHEAKDGLASPFALAELGGFGAAPVAAAKTFGGRLHARLRGRAAGAAAPHPAAELDVDAALGHDEQVLVAQTALTMMGLTDGFARVVLLCGHGSTTENNPYAAALNCGACGGHEGGPNARAAVTILNKPAVRAALAEHGIAIPDDTWFVAGRHDTTTDRVDLLDLHLAPASHAADLERLQADLRTAGAVQAEERGRLLPGGRGADERSTDWAEVRPEWGLARNAAFIVGPRSMTAGLDLECRTFLHSYEAGVDPDGTAIETILTAPLVVAQWINAQYYFSTTDPEVLGAGDKVVHNVVGGIGVLQGAGGDLRIGLPRQACFAGDRPYHEPLRLLAVVQAPLALIDKVVERNAILRHFFDGEWVGLAAREAPGDPWRRRTGGVWLPWQPGDRDRAGAPA